MERQEAARPQEYESTQDVRVLIEEFSARLADLKVKYEQYFMGVLQFPPDKMHADLKRLLRALRKAPFKSTAVAYKLRCAETTYSTYNTYWQKVLREKEEGTYHKDVFKADLREKNKQEEAFRQTEHGIAEGHIENLFRVYEGALEKQMGKKCNLDYGNFRKNLVSKMNEVREKTGGRKVKLKLVMKNGKVTIKAVAKSKD